MTLEQFHEEFLSLVSRKIGRELRISAPTVKRYLQGKTQPVPFAREYILKRMRRNQK